MSGTDQVPRSIDYLFDGGFGLCPYWIVCGVLDSAGSCICPLVPGVLDSTGTCSVISGVLDSAGFRICRCGVYVSRGLLCDDVVEFGSSEIPVCV